MSLARFRAHVSGINSVQPLRKLENDLQRVLNQNERAQSEDYSEEAFFGTEVSRLDLIPEDAASAELAMEHLQMRLLTVAPGFNKFPNGTWVDLTFSDGRKWTGIVYSQNTDGITISNGLSAVDGQSEMASCAWSELDGMTRASVNEYRAD